MNRMSLRTKGLLLIVLVSLIPLLLAGAYSYYAVRDAMLDAEMKTIAGKQNSLANDIAAWMAVRKAEVLVMSRTDVVRFGTEQERREYFYRELFRSGLTYHAIGFIDSNGKAVRSDGNLVDMGEQFFFKEAMKGEVLITDPFMPAFSDLSQSFIAAPVQDGDQSIIGVLYATIPLSYFTENLQLSSEASSVRLYNDAGQVIYGNDDEVPLFSHISDPGSELNVVAAEMLSKEEGIVHIKDESGRQFAVFFSNISGTPWRIALQEPIALMTESAKPLFWKIIFTIAISELLIAALFYLFFERIVKRIESILPVTEKAAAGQFRAEHLDTSQRDEIGQLAESVNGMMEHLEEMFDRLGAIINQNQYGFIVLDENYRVAFLNKTAEDILGYKTEELAGHATPLMFMDLEELRREAEKLSVALGREVQPGLDVFRELRGQKFSYEREWTFVHKDGVKIPILHSSNGLRDRNGKFAGVVGMIRDISDRKQVEKTRNRLLNIVESAKDMIASVDEEGKLVYMNRAGRELLGLGDMPIEQVAIERHMDQHVLEQLLKGAELARQFGYWESGAELLRLGGEPVHVSMVIVANTDEDTGERFYSCIARDISEQKLVQEELVRATLEAEEANQAKSQFLALMSHEIRTPLNGIIGLTQLMRKTSLSISQKDYMDKMALSSESLLRIINDVLDLAKIEAQKVEVERLPFQPEELLNRLANQLSVFMGGKEQFEFLIQTPERLPNTLFGDAMRLEQVLLNLCMNAIKFTLQGIVKLEVRIMAEQEDEVAICFQIKDTGIGMNEEQLGRLFKPFTQADSSTTRKFGGTGLGLVISKRLVEMMGGTLRVKSEEGIGSCFGFTLTFGAGSFRYEPKKPQLPQLAEQTIWIAEDNDRMREHWSDLIEASGLSAITYASWKSLRERLHLIGEGARPRLIMMDMEMPDMYGLDTWLDLRHDTNEAGISVIALTTSYGRDELLQLADEDRPCAILTKPVTKVAMDKALRQVLDRETRSEKTPAKDVSASSEAAAEPADSDSPPIRILLAEDNKINQLVATELLKDFGYEVGLAENGQEVLEKLEAEPWDMILMDIHMPVMDGTEATKIIRGKPEYDNIPIVALTANAVKKDHELYIRIGMLDVITKPLSMDYIQQSIGGWLQREKKGVQPSAGSSPAAELAFGLGAKGVPAAASAEEEAIQQIDGMDVESALQRVNGKQQILLHMMEQFQLDYSSFMDRLRAKVSDNDRDATLRLLHTLKGAAGYLSANELAEAAAETVKLLKESDTDEEKELLAAVERIDKQLSRLLYGLQLWSNRFDN